MPLDPKTIGRYEVQRVLGRGAMGVVYLAQDPLLKRLVAVKVVLGAAEEQSVNLQRFQREAEISARLNHPNIVMVFDVGVDPDAGPFLAMEYVDGDILARLIRRQMDPETAFRLLIQGMGALMAAEAAGIVHRDVKPENILVSRDGRLKLMDFGIARTDEIHLTAAGRIFGTPAYTAPELLLGKEATPATDRYAFAVTAFQILLGAVPFKGATVGATLHSVIHDPPTIPSGCNPALEAVFQRAFAKAPESRYPDLPSFLHALADAVELAPDVRERLHEHISGERPFAWTTPFTLSDSVSMAANREVPSAETPVPSRLPWRLVLPGVALLAAGILLVCLRPRPYQVDIASTPPRADVLVDGRYVGQTPLSQLGLKGGTHLVRLELEGYEPAVREVRRNEWSLQFVLVRSARVVSVVSDPPGAQVLLNGSPVGTTPMPSLSVPGSGTQELRIRKEGYREWSSVLGKDVQLPSVVRLQPLNRR